MNISAPFIKRPVGTSLLALAILLAGGLGFTFLPIAPLPQVEYPVITMQVKLPGADPDTMASAVATPLERQLGRIAGIDQLTSASQTNATNINIQFDLDRNIDAAARDVQAAINAARGYLPTTLPQNPTWNKANPAVQSALIIAMHSDTLQRRELYDMADSILSQKIAQISGVGLVSLRGGAKPGVRVEMNPTLLNKLGVGTEQIRSALSLANSNQAKGMLLDADNAWMIKDNDQLFKADQYTPLVVVSHNGGTVRLGDVATVEDTVEDVRTMGIINGRPGITVEITTQPGANIISVVDRVKALLPQLRASIPPAAKLDVIQDRTTTIRASVRDIEMELCLSVFLVVMVVFFFLRSFRATFIPSVAVPISLVGTFGAMYVLNYSLDNLSLMALAISTGFVVDDAIVVLENITRYLEAGLHPIEAALRGAQEIGFTVLSMSVSLVAVFIPLLLMTGILGRLFREFAVTMSVAIGVSLLASLTVTPMMCARLLKSHDEEKHGGLFQFSERMFQSVLGFYGQCLRWVLRHQPAILGVTIATACLSVYLYVIVPKGFFPQQDTSLIFGTVLAQQDISFGAMVKKMDQIFEIVAKDPAVLNTSGTAGGSNQTLNNGRFNIVLKPMEERDVGADQVIARLRGKLAAIPGARLVLQSSQDLQIGARYSASQYQYTLQGENTEALNRWAPRMLESLARLPELRDVATDQQSHGLQAKIVIDRDTASRLGVAAQSFDDAVYDAFGQRLVSVIYRPLNQYHVVMEVAPQFQTDTNALQNIYVHSTNGQQIPLSAFTHFEPSSTPLAVNHQGQFPAVTLSFNLAPGIALSQATDAIGAVQREINLPASIHPSFQGAAAVFQKSLSDEPILILAALITVYIVLGMLYESCIHPLTILSTIPSAGVGALLALLVTHSELNVIGLIGIILLIGLVKKNAIMMIDFALEAERNEGKPPIEAIYQASLLRFRPIVMTTMAAFLGALPLALGHGAGFEMRRPLGITIIGGLIVSQVLTLFTTPVVYLYLDRLRSVASRAPAESREPQMPLSAEPHPAL